MRNFMLFILFILSYASINAQIKVKQIDGKTFVQVDSKKKFAKPTEFQYKDKDGKVYPIFATGKGGYFVIKTSKRTGKTYRSYLSLQP